MFLLKNKNKSLVSLPHPCPTIRVIEQIAKKVVDSPTLEILKTQVYIVLSNLLLLTLL